MKYFLFLCFMSTALSFSSSSEIQGKWNNFKITHQKTYHTKEEIKRFQIFQENVKKIEEHNKLYENNQVSYKMAINQFADMTSEEFLQYLNKNKPSNNKIVASKYESLNGEAPDEIDWREKGAVTPVKSQGVCAGSWIFGVTESLEGQHFLVNGQLIPLSEQELVDCVSGGCSGGTVEAGYEFAIQHGLASSEDYPSTSSGECQAESVPVTVKMIEYVTVSGDEETLKEAVGTIGPITVEVDALPWQFYSGGILYSEDCTSTLNHVVLNVGYGIEKTNGDNADFWILKNSWGEYWGEQGYIRLARNTEKNCGITENASYPVVEKAGK